MRKHNCVIVTGPNLRLAWAREFFIALKTGLTCSCFIVAATVFCLSPSYADRHCLPSLEAFYGARYALRDESLACSVALERSLEALRSALDRADACGCDELSASMQTLIEEAGDDDGASCQRRASDILGQTEQVKALVEVCHH